MISSLRVAFIRPWTHAQLFRHSAKNLSTKASLQRSYLYVPTSSDRMLEKSITASSDVIIYDLEDSISPAPEDKYSARTRLKKFLEEQQERLKPLHVAVRVNGVTTPYFHDDIYQIISQPIIQSIILPKIHSSTDLDLVSDAVALSRKSLNKRTLQIIPSIESARGMWNLGSIAGWASAHGSIKGGSLTALLFAAEDYCADTSIIRTPSRRELLFTRSQIVIAAKAFSLEAIDMVCVDFRNLNILKDECVDGRQLGFTGKQAIHPSQVAVINSTYVPSQEEIERASKIIQAMKLAHKSQKGAADLDGKMIDAPMIKQESILDSRVAVCNFNISTIQAQRSLDIAASAGLEIPNW
ncbi:hypothetical protein GALMADRAFT_836735 [Galerina marginata CBS 339.88]|uniref:HpcH/HpaI aldolase/citrate lyase domain-containing protein n=1 Tax=Galerina marginata (strain CBS 339.88) TaxID=685588 RepID=A0A067TUK1_GALM3|nr:hypothetical protein GALMADRAFT_836735 [Galerina marginata CBS 339.88]